MKHYKNIRQRQLAVSCSLLFVQLLPEDKQLQSCTGSSLRRLGLSLTHKSYQVLWHQVAVNSPDVCPTSGLQVVMEKQNTKVSTIITDF